MRILLCGNGIVSEKYLDTYRMVRENVKGYVISDDIPLPQNSENVFHISDLCKVEFDELDIANSHFETVVQILEVGIKKEKIVLCYVGLVYEYLKQYGKLDVRVRVPAVLTSMMVESGMVYGNRIGSIINTELVINEDYCRRGTLQLLAREINERGIIGDVAELGVYRGDFSQYINEAFPDRNLYLFDTFEGFWKEQEMQNVSSGFSREIDIMNSDFSDTCVSTVMKKMIHPHRVIIRKGLFPETIPDEPIGFAFVSIDCDLYQPILDGLRYFFPRLSNRGYIMLHDYNNAKFSVGVKKALSDYEEEIGERVMYVPIPDESGSIVIMK
jgi:O-methyltransferase